MAVAARADQAAQSQLADRIRQLFSGGVVGEFMRATTAIQVEVELTHGG